MKFKVITGGLALLERPVETGRVPEPASAEDVRTEAARRSRACGFEQWRMREMFTGVPMPQNLRYLQMQIEFVAQALSAASAIPDDFREDRYWPPLH
jgi:hypothetical protein